MIEVHIELHESSRLVREAKLYAIGGGTAEVRRRLIGWDLFDYPE